MTSTKFKVGQRVYARTTDGPTGGFTVVEIDPWHAWSIRTQHDDGWFGLWKEAELMLPEEVAMEQDFKVGDKGVVENSGIPHLDGKLVVVTYVGQGNYIVKKATATMTGNVWAIPKSSLTQPKTAHTYIKPGADVLYGKPVDVVLNRVTLSEEDPFEAALIQMVTTNRAKRKDYANDGDIFSNFREVAAQQGFESPVDSVDTLIATKQARLKALKANARDPQNESVIDTYLDRAVYAVIALALLREEANDDA